VTQTSPGFEPTPGTFYDDLPDDVYHSAPGLSSSQLKKVYQWSPHHFKHAPPLKDTDALREGRLLHSMVLEPHTVDDKFAFPADWTEKKPNGNKKVENYTDDEKAYMQRLADAEGKTAIKDSRLHHQRIADAICDHPLWQKMQGPQPIVERSYWWSDPKTGLLLKFRADSLNLAWFDGKRALIVDLKGARDPRPWAFSKQCHDLGYEFSAAMYCEGASQMLGGIPVDFCWFAFQKESPYGVTIAFPGDKMRERGARLFRHSVDKVAECTKTGVWPGIGNGRPVIIEPPAYAAMPPKEEA
jgi:hypothetical protein